MITGSRYMFRLKSGNQGKRVETNHANTIMPLLDLQRWPAVWIDTLVGFKPELLGLVWINNGGWRNGEPSVRCYSGVSVWRGSWL